MLKSAFITLYLLFLVVGAVITGSIFFTDLQNLTGFTAFLTHLFCAFWFIYIYTMPKGNSNFVSLMVTVAAGITLLISFASFKINGTGSLTEVYLALVAFIGWLIYNLGYAKQAKDGTGLLIGAELPDGSFTTRTDETIRLSSIKTKKLLVFHRGNWCPFCVEQQKDLNAHLDKFTSNNTAVVFISSQPPKSAFVAEGIYDLQDKDVSYGESISISAGNILPLGLTLFGYKSKLHQPYALLLDEQNKVMAIHKTDDYRKRPSAEYFLRYLNKA